jgi:GNAT superfamily N-acetyltransferase
MMHTTNDSNFQVSTDRTRLDVPMIYRYLSENSTWAVGISRTVVERSIENSLCFGGYLDGRQVAFARVVTDYSTFANLCDVFVIPEYRGRGYAKQLIRVVMSTRACRACAASRSTRPIRIACMRASDLPRQNVRRPSWSVTPRTFI